MNTLAYSHLLVVPAAPVTVNNPLMMALAEQIINAGITKAAIIAITSPDVSVNATAEMLRASLVEQKIEAATVGFDFDLSAFTDTDSKVKSALKSVLDLNIQAGALIIVSEIPLAESMTRVFIWDFLGNRRIDPRLNQAFRPGEAGIVDCKHQSRNTLHPEGYQAWAAKVYAGAA